MARYRLFSQDSEINVGRRVLRAGDDGVFDVLDGGADEAALMAAGAVPAVGQTATQAAAAQALIVGARARRAVATQRLQGYCSTTSITCTMHQLCRAPAHFDMVQFVIRGLQASGANAMKMSACSPAQRGNGYAPLDGAGASLALTPVTWGSTDRHSFRNPGGGAATVFANSASGLAANSDVIENDAYSDWLVLPSSDRVDVPTAPPLLMYRLYGTNPAAANWPEMSDVSSNPWTQIDPDFYSGYWGGVDNTATPSPGAAPVQQWAPSVEVRYLLRGQRMHTLGGAGDSVMQGWIPATSVPQFGANVNGYVRRLVAKLNAAGIPTAHLDMAHTGHKSRMFHERALNAILAGHLTDLIVKPWSVNEAVDGVASIGPALRRTEQLVEAGRRYGVNVILEYAWGGNGLETNAWANAAIAPWMESMRAAGVPVLDIRSTMNNTGVQPQGLKDIYKNRTAGGGFVDGTHLNDLACEAAAQAAFDARFDLGLG